MARLVRPSHQKKAAGPKVDMVKPALIGPKHAPAAAAGSPQEAHRPSGHGLAGRFAQALAARFCASWDGIGVLG
jgi:hypothetical protein